MEKTEVKGFYKKSEGVIINKDSDSLKAYKKKKEQAKKMKEMENDVAELKSDIKEIKDLLRSLVK